MSYELFLERMKKDLQEEYPAFVQTLSVPFSQSLRINPKKGNPRELVSELQLSQTSPYNPNAYLVGQGMGLLPQHIQGRFYLQEPSASSVVESMNIAPDDLVLDLCAAPGSKSTQILSKLQDGFLVSNELSSSRAQALLSNMERMGAENFMVLNQPAQKVSHAFAGAFDKVLVDAPCSGEGMIKKHDQVAKQWSQEYVEQCAIRQKEILDEAVSALKEGGELTYSTCTFSKEENEQVAAWLLQRHPELEQVPVEIPQSRSGYPTAGLDESKVARIFPMDGGEGHFVARFKKKSGGSVPVKEEKNQNDKQVRAFLQEQMEEPYPYLFSVSKKDRTSWYGSRHPFLHSSLPVLRQGVYLGDQIKNRFEPAYAFYLSESRAKSPKASVETTLEQMNRFMHGEQLNIEAPKGYVALTYENIPYGFGKSDGKRITNKIPKGLRLQAGSNIKEIKENK